MPAHKKLLPRPCPQCGLEYGGMQFVIFNPEYSNSWKYNKVPYIILRISHYSKEHYNSSSKNIKKNRTKIWHNFRISKMDGIYHDGEHIPMRDIFNQYDLEDRKSITMSVNQKWFETIQKHGWPLWISFYGRFDWESRKAHFINKGGLKKCDECHNYFKELKQMRYPKGFASYSSSLLCNECYNVDEEKLRKWKIEKKKITLKIKT